MDTHRLRYFLRIADEGSINRAASVLGVAQPALSRQVRILEEDLGVTLFRRTARGVQLTEEGERLRAMTAAPLRQLELAMQYAGSPLARVERGLHVGLPPAVARVFAGPLLGNLGAAFPKVSFQVTVAGVDEIVEGMLQGAIDIGIIVPTSDRRLFYRDLLTEDLVLVGGAAADLQPDRAVPFTRLADLPLILPATRTGIRTDLENAALRLEMRLNSKFSTDSLQVTEDLIRTGHGYGVLPLSAVGAEIKAGALRYAPISGPALTQELGSAASSQLELPRGFAIRIGEIIRAEAERQVQSGAWDARMSPSDAESRQR
ncbi:LysR family transcriptional regulator [Frankia sp. AgB1.9]|uniref:LysR family transcriptional regulator n=1 Tax=unclassified Frankia TaxID=2632575 RepID=UPI001931C579|nr:MULTISPECIES: LysR family transcriptional regulator [unclassified Frankia]MBL7494577.1 LysR family transcriptional regulator [Frankia sp. AgW1.1]MBL7550799.1 LysR family transcriptional regulator [Frankia sp. AgB1.9]MBL7625529.1 LysR family transcriptional regulator [Frankia sp. AgB1.8]